MALTIGQQQLRALQPLAESAVVRNIAHHLVDNHPACIVRCRAGVFTVAEAPNAVLDELIQCGITLARQYGFSWESDLAAFVTLMFVVAPNFHDHPSARRILLDPDVPPDSRLREMWDGTTEEEWEQMKEAYNPEAWQAHSGGAVSA